MLKVALRFIWYDKPKAFGILFGIILSIFLIGQNIGIGVSLLESTISLARNNAQYIWVANDKTKQVSELSLIDMRIARELMSVKGVKRVSPMVAAMGSAKFSDGTTGAISVIGVDTKTFAGGPWNVTKGSTTNLLQSGAITTDEYDAAVLNNVKMGERFEINGNSVFLATQTKGARGLGLAYSFMSIQLARQICGISPNSASAFLVEWENGYTPEQVVGAINKEIPNVKAWTGEDFTQLSLDFFITSSGTVASFGLLVTFAIITGFAIVGLTMFSSVKDRIKDYGTIKAIGGTNSVIRKIILWQAIIFSIIGFLVAYVLLLLFVKATEGSLDIQITPILLAFLIVVTLCISIISSLFAMRKIIKLEPVEIFRM
jgi:putative ABC transport system permease protein